MNANIKNILKAILILILFSINLKSQPTYKMILSAEDIGENIVELMVTMESTNEDFLLSSYQCAFSFNQDLDISKLKFSYEPGTSSLINEPKLYYGIDNYDGENEVTFVSYIGNDLITKSRITVGKFTLEGTKASDLNLQWNFDGTISTIITGPGFENITNPNSHFNKTQPLIEQNKVQFAIENSVASAVYGEKFTDKMLYDGITSMSNGGNYTSSSDGRWAVAGFPNWVTLDLGELKNVQYIKLDPFGSEKGISYDCEFYKGTYENKEFIKKETTQIGDQWSQHELNVETRYLTLVFTGSEGNNWCDIWEAEIYGTSSTTSIESTDLDDYIPNEYAISQNYPNPFNPTTNVDVKMKDDGNVKIEVYSIIGEKVLDIYDGQLAAGFHKFNIDASGLASGIYVYKLNVEDQFVQFKKMNLLK